MALNVTPQDINQTVAVTTSLAAIGTAITLNGIVRGLSVEITNTGANALTDFEIWRQFSVGGAFVPWVGGTDFATPTNNYNASITNTTVTPNIGPPNTLPAAAVAWIDFNPGNCVAVQFYAKAGTATTLTIVGGASSWPIH